MINKTGNKSIKVDNLSILPPSKSIINCSMLITDK